ncbi:cGMP-dependent protein kinase egl-4 [Phytophthora cinnamomi]|uniref:cGMP-dependent protein kinase egl-4 n=1 Tax=Phytophthora cinnamomi TaxID=4785 RepID=UPI00355A6BF2|nr:cGMP-dependent protein kinase egl-4 [Phytophthora cinnamomi]
MAPPQANQHVTPRGPITQSTNPIYVYTKFVVASARATSAIAAAMMATSNSSGVNELKALHNSANALSSPRERSGRNSPREVTHAYTSLVDIVRPRTVPVLSPRQAVAAASPRGSAVRRESKLPVVRKQSESSSSSSNTGRDQENQQERPRTSSSTAISAPPLTGDREVFPSWIRERKDFQVFFPRFSEHVVTDEEILQQGVPKEPSERNIVELQCIARWIMKIPSMSTFLDLNQATEIAKLAKYRAFRPHEYVFRKGDVGDACYLVLSGEVYILIDGEKVASVTKNAAFGDIALQLENATRGADVQAATPSPAGNVVTLSPGTLTPSSSQQPIGCEVLMIMAEDYHKTLARCQTRRRKHLVNWLHTEVTLFRDCVESKLHFFELVSIDVPLKRGEVLYTQGESVGAFYVVRSGRVRLEVDIQYERRHRWPCGKHSWKQQVHAVRSRVPFHTEDSAGFFGFEMFIEGQQTRAYTVVADSPTVELIALNRVDCFSPYFSFTPRALDRIHDKNDKYRDMAQRKVQQQLRAFQRSQTAAAHKNIPETHPPVVVQRKFPHSHETPEFQFPCLRPAKWKADNEVVSALQQACQ